MSDNVTKATEKFESIAKATEEALNGWSGEGCLQFPTLLGLMAVKFNWDEQEVRKNDPLIRFFIREHDEWHVTRGAHGGIMRMSDKQKKEQARTAKSAAKEAARAAVEASTTASTTSDTEE
jgi:hypothetical protein